MINVAILGLGIIAQKMASTLSGMIEQGSEKIRMYAVAARDGERAKSFAQQYGFEKAYGSYEELVSDPEVQLVYIATPHSHHDQHMRLCLEHGKHVLCEKAFTVNEKQAREIIDISHRKGLYVAEAIWSRYQPSRKIIRQLIEDGAIGTPHMLTANLSFPLMHVERIRRPELAGGALLDVGIYALNFASMVFGDDIAEINSTVRMQDTGVDMQETITLVYQNGNIASLCSAVNCLGDCRGVVYGSTGVLWTDMLHNPSKIMISSAAHQDEVRTVEVPPQITGYEYEVEAAVEAIENGRVENDAMPHSETLRMLQWMDTIRAQWGLVYPFE